MKGGNFPWFSSDTGGGLVCLTTLAASAALGLPLSLLSHEPAWGCLFLHRGVLSPPCVASLDASDAPIPRGSDPVVTGAAWAWYFLKGLHWLQHALGCDMQSTAQYRA